MICRSCGTTVPDHYKFCIKCGSQLESFVGQAPAPAPKHFSLEDIARQQSEKNESRIGLSAAPAPTPAPAPAPAPPAPPARQASPVNASPRPAGPAVPLGGQSQVCFSIFSDEAAVKMQEIENKKI